jgi:putative ABC transport system permease protein
MPETLATIVDGSDWVVRTGLRRADPLTIEAPLAYPMLALAVDLEWTSRIDFVAGSAPAAWTGDETDGVDRLKRAPIDIALSADSAEQLGLTIGDLLDYRPTTLRVAGIYEPRDRGDEYWVHAIDLAAGEPRRSIAGERLVYASAYIEPASAIGLLDTMATAEISAWYRVDANQLTFADAPEARDQARGLMALGRALPSFEVMAFQSGFPNAIDGGLERVALVTSLLALAVSGPLGVVIAVFALGVQSVLDPRRSALTLVSARGGSGLQVRLLMLLEGVLISVPAAALAILAAAILIPAPVGPEAYVLPVLLAFAPPVLFTIASSPRSLRSSRADIAVRARGGARWVIEVAAIGLAFLSLYLLFRRGLAQSSLVVGIDPLLVATPLLLSLAMCVVVLRLYPALMLAVQGWTRTRGGAVGLVGAARAVRAPALGFAAALALIVGISIAVFSTVLSTTVSTALDVSAQTTVGADLRVQAPDLNENVVDAVAAVNGVDATAGLERVANVILTADGKEQPVSVVLADFTELSKVRPDLDLPTDNSGLSFIASEDLVEFLGDKVPTVGGAEARLAGTLPATALPIVQPRWILVDAADAGSAGLVFSPQELLVATDAGADRTALAVAIDTVVRDGQSSDQREAVRVIDASTLLVAANAEPVVAGLRIALLLAAIITALLSVLAIVLASLSAGPRRNRLIGVLRILGMSPRQLSRLVLWEFAPVTLTAIVAGTALGVAELWLVTAALDLRPFLRATIPPVPTVDVPLVVVVVGGFALVVILAGIITTGIGRRFSPASSVKIGVE